MVISQHEYPADPADGATRTEETVVAYRARYKALRRQAERELGRPALLREFITWFCNQDGRWSAATIRLYRAAVGNVLLEAAEDSPRDADALRAYRHLVITSSPCARPRGGAKRTSARKRKSMRYDELTRLRTALSEGDRFDRICAGVVWANAHLGLRPVEWHGSVLIDTDLHVRCAKTTNGRGIASIRPIDLTPIEDAIPGFIAAVEALLEAIHRAVRQAGSRDAFWQRLRSRVARACKRLRIPRIAPYTTRHIGLATAKQVMPIEQVAALAGHKTTRTTTERYARRSVGLARYLVSPRPDADLVRRVVIAPEAPQARAMSSDLRRVFPPPRRRW
jgi:integrase